MNQNILNINSFLLLTQPFLFTITIMWSN